jgi:hypothetical protein
MEVTQLPSNPGTLAIRAEHTTGPYPISNRLVWWEIGFRPLDGSPGWFQSYGHQAVAVPKGQRVPMTFSNVWEVPPGDYRLFISVKYVGEQPFETDTERSQGTGVMHVR